MKRIISATLAFLIAASFAIETFSASDVNVAATSAIINNSSLMPKIIPDSEVTTDENGTPDWAKTLIFGEVNLNTATEEGTLEAAIKVLDHYSEMGINGLWVAPVYDPGDAEYPNGYENLGTHTINPKLTGTGTDYEAGWKKLAWFIDEAHKRNIRVLLDVISWGLRDSSQLVIDHPNFISTSNGAGSYYYNWNDDEFVEWYISTVVNIGVVTGCDGFRYDTEPSYAGYEVDGEIRKRLWAIGKKPFMMSERESEHGEAYDVGQNGMTEGVNYETYKSSDPVYFWLDKYNIVDSIKEGKHYGTQASQDLEIGGNFRYYTYCVLNHDYSYTVVNGNRAAVGYQAMYTPYIPVILLGEEWGNPQHNTNPQNSALYFNAVDWSLLDNPENRALYEDIKSMIRIRRSYPELFAYYPEHFKDSNICKVNVTGCEVAQPYARYAKDSAMIVVPNFNIHNENSKMTVYLPFKDTGLDYYSKYTVTDAQTGNVVVSGSASKVAKFTITVPHNDQRVFLVKAAGKVSPKEVSDADDFYFNNNSDSTVGEDSNSKDESEPKYTTTIVTKRKKKKGNNEEQIPLWPFICAGIGVLVVGAGVTAFIIVKKKKGKSNVLSE